MKEYIKSLVGIDKEFNGNMLGKLYVLFEIPKTAQPTRFTVLNEKLKEYGLVIKLVPVKPEPSGLPDGAEYWQRPQPLRCPNFKLNYLCNHGIMENFL